ncbi:MAG: hypothetical protein M0Z28_31770 [Rhodospirillales bacterium]|nr:hypothetical protein [Rhodospirillales bacterium]
MLKLTVGSGVSALAIEQFFTWAQRIEQGGDPVADIARHAETTTVARAEAPKQITVPVTVEPQAANDAGEEDAPAPTAEQPKKRRGRPRKTPEVAPAGMTAEDDAPEDEIEVEEPVVPPVNAAPPPVVASLSAEQARAVLGMMAEPPAPVAAIPATISPAVSGVAIPPAAEPVAPAPVAVPPQPPLAETAIPAAMPAVPPAAEVVQDGVPTVDQLRAECAKCMSVDPALPFQIMTKQYGFGRADAVPPEKRAEVMLAIAEAREAARAAKAA